ncbi:MAG: phosphorylase family protein [Acidiferrobacteraceae bacterium]
MPARPDNVGPDRPGLVVSCGGGAERARATARRLHAGGACALVSWGVCGALSPVLEPGALVLPARVGIPGGTLYGASEPWRQQVRETLAGTLTVHDGDLIQVSEVVATAVEKEDLHRRFRAVAVDMESAAVAEVASEARLPFLCVRAVVDAATTSVPAVFRHMIDDRGRIRLARLLVTPGCWPAVIRLGSGFRAAEHTLRVVAGEAGEALLAPSPLVRPSAPGHG